MDEKITPEAPSPLITSPKLPPQITLKTKRKYTSIKRNNLLNNIKDLTKGKSLKEIGLKAGYTKGSRQIYRHCVKSHILTYTDIKPDEIKASFRELYDLAKKKNDYSNANRSMEALARINAMFKDKIENTIKDELNPKESNEDILKDIDIIHNRLKDKEL